MKLIDADLFLEEISKGATVEGLKKLVTECQGVSVTVNAEPVVRCKDCKYARNIESEWICEHLSGTAGFNVLVNGDSFCSYGERRDL